MYGVKSVGSVNVSSSESSKEAIEVMRHRLLASSSRLSKANSRSGAGMSPTRTSSLMIGIPPSISPAWCKRSSFSRKLFAETNGALEISIIRSRRTRGVMSANSPVKMGLCLLLRNGYAFRFVSKSYDFLARFPRSLRMEFTYMLSGSIKSAVHFATNIATENGST